MLGGPTPSLARSSCGWDPLGGSNSLGRNCRIFDPIKSVPCKADMFTVHGNMGREECIPMFHLDKFVETRALSER